MKKFIFSLYFLKLCICKNNTINIAMALDDNYIYPTIVSITSIMLNSNPFSNINIYIMHPFEFNSKNKKKLLFLEKKFVKLKINLFNMKLKYKFANQNKLITTPAYYRLSLSELIPNLNKIIWIDSDTLTLTSLEELYNLNISNLHYKGWLDHTKNCVDKFTNENDHCICSGVMLLNLNELRKDNMTNNYIKFIEKNNKNLHQHDQTVINAVSYKKIDILPAKYGMYNYKNLNELIDLTNGYRYKFGYSLDERIEAYFYPSILHYVNKPWKKKVNRFNLWWEYAKKTDFYYEIYFHYYWFYYSLFLLLSIIIYKILYLTFKKII